MISRPCREKSAIQDTVDQQSCEKWTALRDPAWCPLWDDETPEKCQGKRCGFVRKGRNANKLTGKTIKIDTQKKRWRVCVQWFHGGKKNNVQLNRFIRVEAPLPITHRQRMLYSLPAPTCVQSAMQQQTLLTVAVYGDTWNLLQHPKIHTDEGTAAVDHQGVMSFPARLWRQSSNAEVQLCLEGCHTLYFNCVSEMKWSISVHPTSHNV